MVLNPFRSNKKWRHRSTTIEMRDEQDAQLVIAAHLPPKTLNLSPPQTEKKAPSPLSQQQQQQNKKQTTINVPFNSDSLLNGIGDYIFHSPLGDGKFSKVFLAYHYLTGEKVAIKVINKRAHAYRVMSRLVREIELMQVLDHENIVKLYETYETADAIYLTMEYVEGCNLEEYLKKINKNVIPEDEARDIFRQVVKAIDHCHSRWVVHRDLKTPNILLTSTTKQVKIADFGLGNRYGLQRLKTVCGSMLYYSPEIVSAKPYVGPEVDCWCLGIMLFRMTAGRELFSHARTPSELKKFIIGRHYTFPPHLSKELQYTIQKCLSIDRYDRLSLQSFLSHDPWFNKFGVLENIFQQRPFNPNYNALEATESYALSARTEDSSKIYFNVQNSKKQCRQDLQEEKRRTFKIPKTIIFHIFHPSTYFTSATHHSSNHQIDLKAQFETIHELNKHLLAILKQVRLRDATNMSDLKSPISHLFRKLKKTTTEDHFQLTPFKLPENDNKQLRKTSSALNLSQLYQRVTQDHIKYYSIQCSHIHTGSSTTVISDHSTSSSTFVADQKPSKPHKRLSHRLSMAFFSTNTLPTLSQVNTSNQQQLQYTSQVEMVKLLRLACEILGITYYQASSTRLICLLTLRNQTANINGKRLPHLNNPSATEDDVYRKHHSVISNKSSHQSATSTGWWSRQMHRLSAPLLQLNATQSGLFATSSATSGYIMGNSSHNLLSMGQATQQELLKSPYESSSNNTDDDENTDGFVILTMDVSALSLKKHNNTQQDETSSPPQIVAIRYSKIKGSNKVFKLVEGWMQMILSQHSENKSCS
ncbi:MAG: kinase-like domain-containing protein [Benjaminiella poitrasii]|nr:MAG: kinase-like domain-containing protein [Benjaminiella poitrasii]